MKKLNRSLLLLSTSLLGLSNFTNSYATSYQIFNALNFANPAAINSVKKDEVIIGGTGIWSQFQFSGSTSSGGSGTVNSNTFDALFYGRFAHRFSPKFVFSFDITQPYYTNIQYPVGSFINNFSTQTVLKDINYSPKLSYQVNEKLALGVGFDANNMYNAQLNFNVAPNGNLKNQASSWAYGWDIGLFYAATQATFINLSFYSKIVQHLNGTSTWGAPSNTNTRLSANSILPATFVANVVHFFSPAWLLSGTVRYAHWETLQFITLQNTAVGTITIPYSFFSNLSYELATRYQINDKWAAIGAFDLESNVQPTWTRNPGLPTYDRYYPVVGAEYQITKELKAKMLYAYVWSRPPIDMSIGSGEHITGRERVNVNAVDFSLTYDI